MVERHFTEEMVAHVSVNNVVEGVIQQRAEGSINSAQSSSEPVPLLSSEMWHENISMLQICDQNQVIVCDSQWNQVQKGHISKAIGVDSVAQQGEGEHPSNHSLFNQRTILIGEEFCIW